MAKVAKGVRGVTGVENNISVNPDVVRPDSEIREEVKDALLYDPRVASFNVNVAVDNGEVILTGEVDNLKAKKAAAQDARNTVGVWKVENQINVQPVDEVSQSEITTNVNNALQRDPYVEASEVDVAVNDGVVTLTGVVDSYFEKWQAGDAAVRARGALAVDNNLTVDYEQLTYETYFYDWDPTLYDYDYVSESKTDAEIAEDIGDELYWSPFVDHEEVTVAVNNGVATLTGNVDTWYERNQATEEAYEGGAMSVVNQLDVDYSIQS